MKGDTFNLAKFIAGWRELAADHGLDPATGNPTACDDPGWWQNPAYWQDPGPAHSVVERDAIASIAQQARAAHGLAEPKTIADVVREAWHEDGAARARQLILPLREIHSRRGVTIEAAREQVFGNLIKRPA